MHNLSHLKTEGNIIFLPGECRTVGLCTNVSRFKCGKRLCNKTRGSLASDIQVRSGHPIFAVREIKPVFLGEIKEN